MENKAIVSKGEEQGIDKDGFSVRWTLENGLGLVFVVRNRVARLWLRWKAMSDPPLWLLTNRERFFRSSSQPYCP